MMISILFRHVLGEACWVNVRGLDRAFSPHLRGEPATAQGWYGVRRWRLQRSPLQKIPPVRPLPERAGTNLIVIELISNPQHSFTTGPEPARENLLALSATL